MLHIASSLTDTVGRVFYGEFVKHGVVDMPPINGEVPAKTLKTVPSGYGKRFGERLYATLLSKSRNPDAAEEALSITMSQVVEGKLKSLREGAALREAEQYVVQMALNNLLSAWRKEHGRTDRGNARYMEDIDSDNLLDLSNPASFRSLDHMLPKAELSRLMAELEKLNERAPSWLEAKLDGLGGTEIAQEWGVGKSRIVGWEQRYLPEIKRVLTKYIQDAA
jgi:hypothetical protein